MPYTKLILQKRRSFTLVNKPYNNLLKQYICIVIKGVYEIPGNYKTKLINCHINPILTPFILFLTVIVFNYTLTKQKRIILWANRFIIAVVAQLWNTAVPFRFTKLRCFWSTKLTPKYYYIIIDRRKSSSCLNFGCLAFRLSAFNTVTI